MLRIFQIYLSVAICGLAAATSTTERYYLSGHGPKDAVLWEFECTDGRRAGEKATIPVPSNWEQHGFGTYNYGSEGRKSSERGLYKTRFQVPEEWSGRRIRLVFNGVMTDAAVKVNGQSTGPTHVGGFYQFRYDITQLVKPGENLLEVDVAKVSSDKQTERAERGGDYWVFGGIFRPVWIETVPERWIEHAAIDARADGNLTADVTLNAREAKRPDGPTIVPERIEAQVLDPAGHPVGKMFSEKIPAGGTGRIRVATQVDSPDLWTAETPKLYTLRISRMRGEEMLHTVTRRFGFRTFEVRDGLGLFLNGQRILLKGVNRHSFRPQTGRALDDEDCYEDVRLIKSMNMNAVRMSHYPPDEAFLEACDELGLYVLDELSGWQASHGTEIGRRLVRELIERDVNHPSILFWDNGNEGGWNRDLDGEFDLYDPQRRRVLHPWDTFGGVDTKHYPDFKSLQYRLKGPNLVMPTEFLHALYDGGGGAGLDEFWREMLTSPFGAGAFFWVFADEGIARSDQDGRIDTFSTYAPDGLVGPNHEKEGSYHAIREIWSPVQIAAPVLDARFDGSLAVENRFDFTPLEACKFQWKLVNFTDDQMTNLAEGNAAAPSIPPHGSGLLSISLPKDWRNADALTITVAGPDSKELWAWTWEVLKKEQETTSNTKSPEATVKQTADQISLSTGDLIAKFDPADGKLLNISKGGKSFALANGPTLTFAKPLAAGTIEWLPFEKADPTSKTYQLPSAHLANVLEIDLGLTKADAYGHLKIEASPDGQRWETLYDSSRRPDDGITYLFKPSPIFSIRLSNTKLPNGKPLSVKSIRLGHTPSRFPAPAREVTITTGSDHGYAWLESRAGAGLNQFRWTLSPGGELSLNYCYNLDGEFLYHGITFDHPETQLQSMRWLGKGPSRVWKNRLRGASLGIHEIATHTVNAVDSRRAPELQGFFSGIRWARLETDAGPIKISCASPDQYLRIGTPKIDHPNTTVEFPMGDLSFLHSIPPIGSKFSSAESLGPAGQPTKAAGQHQGALKFSFPIKQ